MATFSVLINGVDRTSVIAVESFTAELGAKNEITTCAFEIRDETKALEIRGAQSIQISRNGTSIWYGFVGNVSVSFDGGVNVLAVDGQSANVMLDQKAYRKISKTSTGAGGSGTDKGSIRKGSRTIGSEVQWLLSSSACSPGASPIIYDSTKIYSASTTYSDTRDYGDFDAPTLREALKKFVKDAYGTKKMSFWVDADGKLNVQPTGHSVNLIDNFDFDVNPDTSWTLGGGASITTSAGQSTPGTATLNDWGVQLTASTQSAYQSITVTAGNRYYISAGVKNVTNNRAQLSLVWKNSGGTTISTDNLTTSTTGSWVRVEGIYTAPATAVTCVYTLGYTGTTGTVYWDNCNMYKEDASFGVSDTPNGTTTFAPEEYEESSDTSSIINAIAIKGAEYTYGGTVLTDAKTANRMYYLEYPASIAYFGKTFTSAITDPKVSSATKARNAARRIFAESAFPVRNGSYKISSAKLGSLVPVPGTYQIFEIGRLPSAKQVTINRIETVTVLPYGAGEVVYEIKFGASKGNIAEALATLGSAIWGTGLPAVHSTIAEHAGVPEGSINVTRTLTNPQTTGAAAEVEVGASVTGLAKIPVIKKNTALTPTANLPSLADYGETEFPIGSLVLLVPNAGDPHLTKPTLYRSDGASTWTAVTPAQLKSDALGSGAMGQGMVVADSIFAGTIDAGTIDVTNLNASNITTGTLTSIAINSGSGRFLVDSSGNATANSVVLGSTAFTITNAAKTSTTATITTSTNHSFLVGDSIAVALTSGSANYTELIGVWVVTGTTTNTITFTTTGTSTVTSGVAVGSVSYGAGNDATGKIAIVPSATQGAASFAVQTDALGSLYTSVGLRSATAAASGATSTVTTDSAHGFVAGQFVSFHGTGDAAWNNITASQPIQIKTTPTTTTFTISPFLSLSALAADNAGTVRAYKRLNLIVPGGVFVYQSGNTPGVIASGSLALGEVADMTNFGVGTLGTLADGEMGFLSAVTPRYTGGANLFSSNGTSNLSTSGDFTVGTTLNSNNITNTGDVSAVADGGDFIIRHGTGAGVNPRLLFRNGAGTYISGLRATTGTLTHYADSGTTTLGTFVTGTLTSNNQAAYVRADASAASTTSIPAGGFQSHVLSYTSTVSSPIVVASPYMSTASTVMMTAVVYSRGSASSTIYLYNATSTATTVGRYALGIAVVP